MSVADYVVLGIVVSMFGSLMVVVASVAWWSEQPAKPARARAHPSGQSTHAVGIDTAMDPTA